MEIQGKIIQVLPQRSGVSQRSGQPWKMQEYVLETYDRFPRKLMFSFFGANVDTYPLQAGENVTISFDIESRSFVGRDGVERWSTEVRAFRAEKFDPSAMLSQMGAQPMGQPGFAQQQPMAQPAFAAPQQPAPAVPQFPAPEANSNIALDDMPF